MFATSMLQVVHDLVVLISGLNEGQIQKMEEGGALLGSESKGNSGGLSQLAPCVHLLTQNCTKELNHNSSRLSHRA